MRRPPRSGDRVAWSSLAGPTWLPCLIAWSDAATGLLLALVGLGWLCGGLACSRAPARPHLDGRRDAAAVVDLGTQPPFVRQRIQQLLDPLPEPGRFLRVDSNCACADATVRMLDRALSPGDVVPASQPLSIDVTFLGQGKLSDVTAQVRAVFASTEDAGRLHGRGLLIRCHLDRVASLVNGVQEIRILVALPSGTEQEIAVASPIDPAAVKVTGGIPVQVRAGRASADGRVLSLLLHAEAVDRVGARNGQLELPLGPNAFECVPLEVRYYAAERLDPPHVMSRLLAGAVQETPIAATGLTLDQTGDWIRIEHDEPKYDVDEGGSPQRDVPQVGLRPEGQRLVLRIAAGKSPGMFKGRCLVRPRHDAPYRLVLEWAVRVSPNGGVSGG